MASEPVVGTQSRPARSIVVRAVSSWLGGNRLGLVVMALVVGVGAGLGAALFREMVFGATWLVTGHNQFGQQGHAGSSHLPGLGIWFVLIVPVLGGLIYGPLIYRFAREARGHGVPEVMVAVAENGGRIRPQVTIVKAVASAITIGVGGSVGREGPIVQIGSALASTLGQLVRMSETRLRVIVACGAAGGIAATFNAPLTGLFFGFEIVLREFSLDALVATSLAAVTGDVISRAIFGSAPFFAQIPHGLSVTNDTTYLLVAVLALLTGLIGIGFKTFLYWLEDYVDELWKGRPEWARPAVGGIALGVLLLAVPQMYGVGYPVMNQVIGGHVVTGLILLFLVSKVLATSLTLSIGGSGGVFAPSLFIGAMAGMAFGTLVHSLFGAAVGPPALYAVIAMGGVFAAAAQAPLTAIASVAEMTGNFAITLPIMLTCGIAAAVSKYLSYGSVYTTKLLRRGIDIERPKTTNVLQTLTVADAMQPLPPAAAAARLNGSQHATADRAAFTDEQWKSLAGTVTDSRQPQELFSDETLEQALRQLTLYGPTGLPVLSEDREHVQGWITRHNILDALTQTVQSSERSIERGAIAADFGTDDPAQVAHQSSAPLNGYQLIEITVSPTSPAIGRRVAEISWPPGCLVVAIADHGAGVPSSTDTILRQGTRVILLTPAGTEGLPQDPISVVTG
ncbi:MAG TPA: chloride channel protein [Solirubrobacteraceae bacterium]|jgi:CIC family chloride channel protein|nr:chloride channel protein [Solirubrobacteraceae bacterium]